MNEKIKKSLLKSQIFFYVSFVVFLAIGLLGNSGRIPKHDLFQESTAGMYIQTACLLLFLICIPVCLFWFHKKVKHIVTLEEAEKRISLYHKITIIRIAWFDVICALSVGLLLFTNMENAKMFFYMILVFYLFIIPGKSQFLRDTNLNEDGSIVVEEQPTETPNESTSTEDDDDDFIPKNH